MKPINPEVPQVQRHGRQRQKKCADQERACRPIDPVGRDSKNQGVCLLSAQWSAQNNIFFCPGVNPAAMNTGKLLRFHFRRRPELFFYGTSGIGQF